MLRRLCGHHDACAATTATARCTARVTGAGTGYPRRMRDTEPDVPDDPAPVTSRATGGAPSRSPGDTNGYVGRVADGMPAERRAG